MESDRRKIEEAYLKAVDICKPDPLHFLFQKFPGIKFRFRSRCTVTKDRIALKLLHLFRQMVGITDIHRF